MLTQRTVSRSVEVTGIGIHSGKKVTLTLNPAGVDTGICFKRVDLKDAPTLKATYDTVSATENATTIGEGLHAIHTVEHLLGVLYGLGIDNVLCELDGPEIPIMDGSGASFAFLLKETGISNLNASKKFIVITEKVRVEHEDKWAEIEPCDKLKIESTIVFAHPIIKTQKLEFEFSCENFINEICRARTFGFLRDVDYLKRRGLAKGGSLNNAVILDDFKVLNPDGLRFVDEFIRHKTLDTVGDLSLLGHEIAGKIKTYKSGHKLNNMLCHKIIEQGAYKIVNSTVLAKEALQAFELPVALSPAIN